MNIKPLNPNDAKAFDAMSEESKAVIFYALKSLSNDVIRNSIAMKNISKLTNELTEYYCKIYVHAQSLQMALQTNQQHLTLACL